MAKVITQLVIQGKNLSKAAFAEVNGQLDSMNSKLDRAGKAMVGAFSVAAMAGAVASSLRVPPPRPLDRSRKRRRYSPRAVAPCNPSK